MSAHLSPLDPEFRQRLAATQRLFEAHHSPPDALRLAQASLYGLLQRQASYWAFIELFFCIACLCALCVFGVFLFRRVKSIATTAVH
jgi:hypothetical protein